jgi:hypothetical protein
MTPFAFILYNDFFNGCEQYNFVAYLILRNSRNNNGDKENTIVMSTAKGCPTAKAWNWMVFQNKIVFRKSFRPTDQGGLLHPTWDIIERVVSPLHS